MCHAGNWRERVDDVLWVELGVCARRTDSPASFGFLGPGPQYASMAAHHALDPARHRDAMFALDAFEELDLLERADATAWRARLDRLRGEAIDRPLLPESFRSAAREYLAEGDQGWLTRHALEAVGALTWLDLDDARVPAGLVVVRVIPVPPQPGSDVTVASVVLYEDAVDVRWYADERPDGPVQRGRVSWGTPEPGHEAGEPLRGPLRIDLADELGTRYDPSGSGSSYGGGGALSGRTAFQPAPPAAARWLEVISHEVPPVRVPLG